MGDQVLRIKTRSSAGGALTAHILGKHRHPTTSKDPAKSPIVLHHDKTAQAWADQHQVKGRGRRAQSAVEFVCAGVPPYGSKRYKAEGWTPARELKFARACLDWIRRRAGPQSRIAAAAWHRDESAGHLHCQLVPIHVSKLGWTHIREGFETGTGPASARMSRIQDAFHEDVAAGFGMGRGQKGSSAKHQPIDRVALQRKNEKLQDRLKRLTAVWEAVKIWAGRAFRQLSPSVRVQAVRDFESISDAAAAAQLDVEGWRVSASPKSPPKAVTAAPRAQKAAIPTPKP